MTRVLVVDDSKLDRMVHRRWLEAEAFDVREATTADEAVAAALATAFDCVLMDYVMPDGDGLHALQTLRATVPDCPPVILLSCAITEDTRRNAMALGAADCLAKPVGDGGTLAAAVHRAIASRARP